MKNLRQKLMKVCENDIEIFEKVKIQIVNLLEKPKKFEKVIIDFSFTLEEIHPRKKKDLEILDIEIYTYIFQFLKEIGYKSVRIETMSDYYIQYFKK